MKFVNCSFSTTTVLFLRFLNPSCFSFFYVAMIFVLYSSDSFLCCKLLLLISLRISKNIQLEVILLIISTESSLLYEFKTLNGKGNPNQNNKIV